MFFFCFFFFFSSRRRHTRWNCDWSSDVCSSDLNVDEFFGVELAVDGAVGLPVLAEELVDVVDDRLRGLDDLARAHEGLEQRSEERRVGKECRSRWWRYH